MRGTVVLVLSDLGGGTPVLVLSGGGRVPVLPLLQSCPGGGGTPVVVLFRGWIRGVFLIRDRGYPVS